MFFTLVVLSYQLLTLLLKGSDRLSLASNESIFAVMFEFIQTSGRYNDFQLLMEYIYLHILLAHVNSRPTDVGHF